MTNDQRAEVRAIAREEIAASHDRRETGLRADIRAIVREELAADFPSRLRRELEAALMAADDPHDH